LKKIKYFSKIKNKIFQKKSKEYKTLLDFLEKIKI